MICEKCWGDGYFCSISSGVSRYKCYLNLLEKRKDNPCTLKEQAGIYWDESLQMDSRFLIEAKINE